MLLPLMICCMLPTLMRGGGSSTPQQTNETDSWFVTYNIQEAYDTVVKEVDAWRQRAENSKKGKFNIQIRKPKYFVVEQSNSPRLYRVNDPNGGVVSFELTEFEGGGTAIKATYDSKSRALIQDFKAKMPVTIPASGPKNCPTCGKELLPDFKVCPFCGTKVR